MKKVIPSCLMCLSLVLVTSPVAGAARRIAVVVSVLEAEVSQGESFEVPVSITDGDDDVVSYAFRLTYDPSVLKLLEVAGGTFEGFSDRPVTNRAAFDRGQVDFTANNSGFLGTPDSFIVAAIRFQVVGRSGQSSLIRIRQTPKTDITLKRTFAKARPVSLAGADASVTVK